MNNWITTATGREFDLAVSRFSTVDIDSIAHSLSQINRFTGHASRPYSVAEHSLLVADICKHDLGLDVHGQFAALMHDAHEAYCGDLSTPGKRVVGAAWRNFEGQLEGLVRSAFAINTPAKVYAEQIKTADLMALAAEKRDLLPATPSPWAALSCIQLPARIDLQDPGRRQLQWHDWRRLFLAKYHELDYARCEALFGDHKHEPRPTDPPAYPSNHLTHSPT